MKTEEHRVHPASHRTRSSLPLTVFDVLWLKFPPVQSIFFYALQDLSPHQFYTVTLPRLKLSLSLTLDYFYPLAGRIVWPSDEGPAIVFDPNDSVSLKVAESTNPEVFVTVSGTRPFKAIETSCYIPELYSSTSEAAVMSLQVTFFPNHGVAIGMSIHHSAIDGWIALMFDKAWAHICKEVSMDCRSEKVGKSLPPELTPLLQRLVEYDPRDKGDVEKLIIKKYLPNSWNPRDMTIPPMSDLNPSLTRGTFNISRSDTEKLKKLVLAELNGRSGDAANPTLSSFVVGSAFTLKCMVEAKKLEAINVVIGSDNRQCMDLPRSENYFGNCVNFAFFTLQAENISVANLAERIREAIIELKKLQLPGKIVIGEIIKNGGSAVGIAGSSRFGFYDADFGWGRPLKVEISSIDRSEAISMVEARDGGRGMEVGLVLTEEQMAEFQRLFTGGLSGLDG